jgi:hypothetical protein
VGSATVTTGSDGRASSTWTLGGSAGTQQVVASSASRPTVTATFSATALADVAASVAVLSGDQQQGIVGLALSAAPAVIARDQFDNPVSGLEVIFSVPTGSGSITEPIDTTGTDGTAAVGSWTLGSAGGNNLTATVTAAGLTGNPVTFNATGVSSFFDIEVRFSDSSLAPTTAQQQAFDSAVTRWQSLIVGDLASVNLNRPATTCAGVSHPALSETVDDLLIYVSLDSIDGPFGVLGQAGPCMARGTAGLPFFGGMHFDVADLSRLQTNGQLEMVILHEMGHVLGFGTLWGDLGLLQDPSDTVSANPIVDTYFNGTAAIAWFDSVSTPDYTGGQKVPVENDKTRFGVGSLNAHWRESVFDTELMTPQLNSSVPNPLSAVSVGSLGDMGYLVNVTLSDSYAWPAPPAAAGLGESIVMHNDVWWGPIQRVDASGRVIRVVRR